MALTIRTFDPNIAEEQELADFHAMRVAMTAIDDPEDSPPTYEAAVGELRIPPFHGVACSYWAAYLDGRVVGIVQTTLLDGVNSGIIHLEVMVHPDHRRGGIGSQLLRSAMPAVIESGRETVIGTPVKTGSPGAAWAARFGFEITNRTVIQALETKQAPRRYRFPVAPGYQLRHWTGSVPEGLIKSYCNALQAIADAPLGRSAYREQALWTPERIREDEHNAISNGVDERVVVATVKDTDDVVGLTRIMRYSFRPDVAYQAQTAVLEAHRGHGLGKALKGRMMGLLLDAWPDLERIHTSTSAENTHMIDVNLALGYHTHRELIWVEAASSALAGAASSM